MIYKLCHETVNVELKESYREILKILKIKLKSVHESQNTNLVIT